MQGQRTADSRLQQRIIALSDFRPTHSPITHYTSHATQFRICMRNTLHVCVCIFVYMHTCMLHCVFTRSSATEPQLPLCSLFLGPLPPARIAQETSGQTASIESNIRLQIWGDGGRRGEGRRRELEKWGTRGWGEQGSRGQWGRGEERGKRKEEVGGHALDAEPEPHAQCQMPNGNSK